MKTYRRHNCNRQHRSHNTLTRCMFPRAVWISGEGPYASLAWCRDLTIVLFDNESEALTAKYNIDKSGCGGACTGHHEIVFIWRQRRSATS